MQSRNNRKNGTGKAIVFRAMAPEVGGKQVYFMFSMLQVEGILNEITVQSVPFAPSFVEGIALWQNAVLPVMSLEECLGLGTGDSFQTDKMIVVRTGKNSSDGNEKRSVLRIGSNIHLLNLPIPSKPISCERIPEKQWVKGIFEWSQGILVVADIKSILKGEESNATL